MSKQARIIIKEIIINFKEKRIFSDEELFYLDGYKKGPWKNIDASLSDEKILGMLIEDYEANHGPIVNANVSLCIMD